LFHGRSGTWLVGSLAVGVPAGGLSLPEGLDGERVRAGAARALRRLNAVGFERVGPSRGMLVLRGGPRAVQDLVFKEDPEACVVRPSEVRVVPGRSHGTSYGRSDAAYGRLLGLETLDFDLSEVQPGRRSTAVHGHDGSEECFIILSGEGEVHVLRPGESELRRIPVRAGDVVAFPPRYQIAHSFKCTGSEPLRFLGFGAPGTVELGVVDYPLSGKRLTYARPPGKDARYYLPERRDVPYYENEPEG
ncbi:MAG TPA: cupin domain-containing protein, partial [Chloroflexota bacterium]|nr:cupin domain-containing protein [Chloroflexota bacterium]